ncbi:unnamed protein product [Closterium sp. NIES-65]|nr:unnamed protein product [Closterium sp. NIES-65]
MQLFFSIYLESYNTSLAELVARTFSEASGIPVDPDTEVVLSSGQTCAFASACLAVFQPGDDVILFDPAFEAYHGAILIAGANPSTQKQSLNAIPTLRSIVYSCPPIHPCQVYVALTPPHWSIDFTRLAAALTPLPHDATLLLTLPSLDHSLPPVRPSQVYVPLSPPHWSIDFARLAAALTPPTLDATLLLTPPSFDHSLPPIQVYVPLSPPHWSIDFTRLAAALTPRTKGIILNSPCNPTGRVFSHTELSKLAEFCCHHDLLAITDEVYSAFTYGSSGAERHVSLAHWPGMKQRCIVTSSVSKTFHVTGWRVEWTIALPPIAAAIRTISTIDACAHRCLCPSCPSSLRLSFSPLTPLIPSHPLSFLPGWRVRGWGWRVGWAIAPAPIAAAISTISAKLIDTPPAPFQEASRAALCLPPSYYTQLREDYTHKRDTAVAMLLEAGLEVTLVPEGSVFVFARIPERWGVDDVSRGVLII